MSDRSNGSSQAAKPRPVPTVVCPKRRFGGTDRTGYRTVGTYRLYSLDGVGKVMSADWINAADDKEAVEASMKYVDGHRYELWNHSRLVMRIENRGG